MLELQMSRFLILYLFVVATQTGAYCMLKSWKFYVSITSLLITGALITYGVSGSPIPRPWYIFVISGVCAGLLFVLGMQFDRRVGKRKKSALLICLFGFFWLLHWTPFARPLFTIGDYQSFLLGVHSIRTTGHVTLDGVYKFTPYIVLYPAIGQILADIPLLKAKLLTIPLSFLLPLFMFLFVREAYSESAGWSAAILSSSFVLFLRTSVLVEPPVITLPLFVLSVYLLEKTRSTGDRRFLFVLVAFLAVNSWIHLYYALITALITLGLAVFVVFEGRLFRGQPSRPIHIALLGVLILVVVRTQPVWIIMLSGAKTFSPVQFFTNPIEYILPQSGAVNRTTSTTSNHSSIAGGPILNYFQLLLLIPAAILGGIRALSQRARLLLGFGFVCGATGFLVIARNTPQAKYRIYFLIGLVLVIFSSILASYVFRKLSPIQSRPKYVLTGVLFLVVFTYGSLGPVSGLGNDVDPRFGGKSIVVLPSDYEQRVAVRESMVGAKVSQSSERSLVGIGSSASNSEVIGGNHTVLTIHRSCTEGDIVWSSGRFCAMIDGGAA